MAAAPLAWAAGHLLAHPVLPHAIVAPRRFFTSAEAGRVSYYEDDHASGLPLLLLHELGPRGSAYATRGIFDAMRGERPVIAVDMPGYGFSERRLAPLTREQHVRFVEELLGDVSRRYGASVDVVAFGITGEIAAQAALRVARVVRSLALVAPTGFGGFDAGLCAGARALGRALLRAPVVGALVHAGVTSRAFVRAALRRRTGGHVDGALVSYAHAAARQPRARVAALAAMSGALSSGAAVAEIYDGLTVPVLFVHGDDPRLAVARVDALVERHAAFRRSRVYAAGPEPHLERPAETAERLRSFHRRLAVKPQLRVIRGERAGRALAPRRRPARGVSRHADRGR